MLAYRTGPSSQAERAAELKEQRAVVAAAEAHKRAQEARKLAREERRSLNAKEEAVRF